VLKDASGATVISFKRLDARVSVPALMKGDLLIRTAALDEPFVDFSIDRAGSFNLLRALGITPQKKKRDKKTGLPEFLTVERLVLTGGRARWSQPAAGIAAGIDGIYISAGLGFRELAGDITLRTGTGFFTRGGRTIRLAGLSASGLMKNGDFRPCRIDLRTERSRVAIDGGIADVFTAPRFDAAAGFDVSLEEPGGIAALTGRMSGTARGSLTLRGPLNDPSAVLSCTYGGGEILGRRVDTVSLTARLDGRVLTVPSLIARAAGGTLSASGMLDLARAFPDGFLSGNRNPDLASYRADADVVRFPLGAVPLPGISPGGAVSAKASVRGSGLGTASASAGISASAVIYDFSFNGKSRPALLSVAASGALGSGIFRIDSLAASLGNLKMSGAGFVDLAAGAATASITAASGDLSPEAAAFGLDARGSCAIDAAISGPIRRPAVSLRFNGEGLRYKELSFGSVSAEAALDGGRAISLSRLSLANGSSAVSLSGSAPLSRGADGPISLDIRAFDIRLSDFSASLDGRVTLAGSVAGSVMAPEGGLQLMAAAVDLGFWKFDAAGIAARGERGRIYLDPVTIVPAPAETVSAGGWITMRGEYEFSMKAAGVSLGGIAPVRSSGMDGRLSLEIGGRGSIGDPRLDGRIAVARPSFRDRVFNDFLVNVSVADRAIAVKGNMNFDLSGSYSFAGGDFNVSLLFNKTDLSPLLSAMGAPGLDAMISGSVRARGNSRRPAETCLLYTSDAADEFR
ncbi:MAG: hypothetical protein QUU85_10240, partial [Candidatus Eisenbacteria bacterium]|nr:hypothetical protein [Candidatus Eisenbacteria bacterium]